jgi:hypothetical protein
VYQPRKKGAKEKADRMKQDGRINFIAPANYEDGEQLDRIVKAIIDKLPVDEHLTVFSR